MSTISIKYISTAVVSAVFAFFMFATHANAQVYYQSYTPQSESEKIAYLQGVIAQLLAQLASLQQFGGTGFIYQPSGQVLGASYRGPAYEVEAGTGFVRYDRNDIILNGTLLLSNAPYAYVWFEYGEDEDMDERTSRKYVNRGGYFTARVDDLGRGDFFYYRAVAESPSGHRDYGTARFLYVSGTGGSSSRNNDDEPEADTLPARNVDEDSATLRGEIDMNDFRNGVVFFVYGEDEDQIEDVERNYDSYRDVDEDGDDLRKVRVDTNLDGRDSYSRTVTGLDDDTEHFYQICVEYEDDDGDDTLECGGVEDFETDRD